MQRRDVLDLDAIARPISAERPAGPNLRDDFSNDSPYRRVKDARNASSRAERALLSVDARDAEGARQAQAALQWPAVARDALEILTTKSKDLDVCAWLIEALAREHGFEGLRDGFKAATVLVSTYWDTLHPLPDEDGVSTRVAPLANLNGFDRDGALVGAILDIALFRAADGAAYTTGHYLQALEVEKIDDPVRRRARVDGGAIALATLQAAVATSATDELAGRVQDIEACARAFSELTATVDGRAVADAPPSSRIQRSLEQALAALRALARDRIGGESGVGAGTDAQVAASQGAVTAGAPGAPGALGGRDEALAALLRVADYFRRTEPHSPLSYSLEQSVRWARLSLPELLDELIADETARESYRRLVGIRKPEAKA